MEENKNNNEQNMSLFGNAELNLNDEFDKSFLESQDEDNDSSEENKEDLNNGNNDNNNNPIEDENNPEDVDNGNDDNSEDENTEGETSPNIYSSFADVLLEQGVITSLESSDQIKTVEDLVNIFKTTINSQTDIKLSEYIENLDASSISQSKGEIRELSEISEDVLKEDSELAKNLLYRDYLNQGLSEEKAKKFLKKTIDLGEEMVLEEAVESLENIKQYELEKIEKEKENYKLQVKESQKAQEQLDIDVKNKIYNSKDLIKGYTVNKTLQDQTYKSMTEIVNKNADNGQLENALMHDRAKNPIDFDTRMYMIYNLTNGFTDLSNISQTVKSKAVDELEKAIRKTKFDNGSTPDWMQDGNSYDSPIGGELVIK